MKKIRQTLFTFNNFDLLNRLHNLCNYFIGIDVKIPVSSILVLGIEPEPSLVDLEVQQQAPVQVLEVEEEVEEHGELQERVPLRVVMELFLV